MTKMLATLVVLLYGPAAALLAGRVATRDHERGLTPLVASPVRTGGIIAGRAAPLLTILIAALFHIAAVAVLHHGSPLFTRE